MSTYYDSFKKGSIEMLFLKLLSIKDCYGYELMNMFHDITDNIITITAGNMYPTLYKLEDKGYITHYEKTAGKRRKQVYYHITEDGKIEYERMLHDYTDITNAISKIIEYTGDEVSYNDVTNTK